MKWTKKKTASRLYKSFSSSMHSLPELWNCSHKLFSLFNCNPGWALLVPFEWITRRWERDDALYVWFVICVGVCLLVCGMHIMRSFFPLEFSVQFDFSFSFPFKSAYLSSFRFSSISLTNDAKWQWTLFILLIITKRI